MMIACAHATTEKYGKDRHGNTRYRCKLCGKTWVEVQPVKPLGNMQIPRCRRQAGLAAAWSKATAFAATARITGLDKKTVLKLIVLFGEACQRFLDQRMRGLTLDHLQFDEQWTYVAKKQVRLTIDRARRVERRRRRLPLDVHRPDKPS